MSFLGTDGIPPLTGNTCDGMGNRWYKRSIASVLLQDGSFFVQEVENDV